MTVVTITDCGTETPESHCSDCDMRFYMSWNRNPVYDAPEYCPFCGSEIESFAYENSAEAREATDD